MRSFGIAFSADSKTALISNHGDGTISVIDLAGAKLVSSYDMPGCTRPTGLAYVKGGRLISACANGVAKTHKVGRRNGKRI